MELELQLAVLDGLHRVGRLGLGDERAPVPHDHVAGAVLAARDHALEIEVLDRVVLDVDRHPPDHGVERRSLGDRPAREQAADLEPEVVVEAGRAVALDDEAAARRSRPAGRLRRRRRAPASC